MVVTVSHIRHLASLVIFTAHNHQVVIAMTNVYFEDRSAAYLVRLAAFAIIIVAIGRKNRKVL